MMITKKTIFVLVVALFGIVFFYGCDTYKKSFPDSFYAVFNDSKYDNGGILMFRFSICEHDTFSLSMNGVSLFSKYLPSSSSPYTIMDYHTTSGDTIYYYDFVIYQCSRKRAFVYLLNDKNVSFSVPMKNRAIDINGCYSNTNFSYSVSMGSFKQLILHHFHKDSLILYDEYLQGIRFYE